MLAKFQTVGLDDLASDFLMKRREIKFFFHRDKLEKLLQQFSTTHDILSINNKRYFAYQSDYFDTEDFQLYHMHHNQRRNRYKFRFRSYLDSGSVFFEIKHKNNKMITNKIRMEVTQTSNQLDDSICDFIEANSPIDPSTLMPSIRVDYDRVTLIQHDKKARLTIDTNISMSADNQTKQLEKLAILEFKFSEDDDKTAFCNLMAASSIHPERISKYCVGVANLKDGVKTNLFKQKLSKVDKIQLNGAIL